MSAKIYSAAKAVSVRKGQTNQEVWDTLIRMFKIKNNENLGTKTFIYGGYPLQEKVWPKTADSDMLAVGNVYKAYTVHQTEIYITIQHWDPFNSFSFVEQKAGKFEYERASRNGLTIEDGLNAGSYIGWLPVAITEFNLRDHPEGTVLEIIRREKDGLANKSIFDPILALLDHRNRAGWAAARLCHIVGGLFPSFKNGDSMQIGEYTITRDDSLRVDL